MIMGGVPLSTDHTCFELFNFYRENYFMPLLDEVGQAMS